MKLVFTVMCGLCALQFCSAKISETAVISHLNTKLPIIAQGIQDNIDKLSSILSGPQQSANSIVENFLASTKDSVNNGTKSVCDSVKEALKELEISARHEANSCLIVSTSSLTATLKDLKTIQPQLTTVINNVQELANRESQCDPLEDLTCVPETSAPLLKSASHLAQRASKATTRIGNASADTLTAKVSRCVSNAMVGLASEAEAVVALARSCN